MANTANVKTYTGKDLTMLVDDKSVYHAQSHECSIAPEFEEWETKDTDGTQKEFSKCKVTVNVNGIACVKSSSDQVHDTPDLIAQTLTGQSVTVLLKLALDGTTPKTYSMTAWITDMTFTGEVAKKATYKATLEGYNLRDVTETGAAASASHSNVEEA